MISQPMMDPIVSRLRPRSVQEIIDNAFRLYRKYFLTFLAITAIIFIPVNLGTQFLNVALQGNNVEMQRNLRAGSSSNFSTPGSELNQYVVVIFVLAGLLIAAGVLGGLLQYLSQGALTSAIADSYMERPVSFGGAYKQMFKHVGPLIGAIVLQVLISIGIWVPTILIFTFSIVGLASGSDRGGGAAAALGLCVLGLPLFLITLLVYAFILVRIRVVVPVIMVEGLGPVQAIRRSWRLVQNYWWRTLALVLVLGIINLVISAGPAYLILGIVTIFTRSLDPVTSAIITGTGTVIMSALFLPLELVSTTLYYFDLRVRKEGFDIEQALDRRYAPDQPGYYPGQYAPQAAPPPTLGYGTQAQPYAQQAYTQPGYSQPYQQPQGISYTSGTPTINTPSQPASSGSVTAPLAALDADTQVSVEHPPAQDRDFSTPSIAEQAARLSVEHNREESSETSRQRDIPASEPEDTSPTAQPGQS